MAKGGAARVAQKAFSGAAGARARPRLSCVWPCPPCPAPAAPPCVPDAPTHRLALALAAPVRAAITLSIVAVAYLPYEWERTIVTGKSRSGSPAPAAGGARDPQLAPALPTTPRTASC